MNGAFGIAIVLVFVVGVLAVVAFALFKLTPFAGHRDRFRDPVTHKRLGSSPHLETRDEFEHREFEPER